MQPVNLSEKLKLFSTHWDPHVVGDYNANDVMVVKFKGEFPFHQHENTDDFFLVLDGEMIMDTRGLDEIGLPDLQCHFRGHEPNAVAAVLGNTGIYIAENGAVIESGHTVEGIDAGSKWKCQYEESILEPKRTVLDLDPGAGFAAGNRS